jgi:hypothetical protein
LFNSKIIIYGILISSILFTIGYSLYKWHYGPLEKCNDEVISIQNQLTETGNCLNMCETNLSKQMLQGYIDGIGENNENIFIDFDNLVY